MKINEPLKTISGNYFTLDDGKTKLTFKDAAIICCETYKSEKSVPGQALKIIAIGSKIFNAKDEVEFTEEEKALLREVIEGNKVYLTGVTGAMLKLLS